MQKKKQIAEYRIKKKNTKHRIYNTK